MGVAFSQPTQKGNMSMTDQARLAEVRALSATLDRLTRNPKRISPTAPWIIPATMIVVAVFALICLAIKLIMNYLNSKHEKTKDFEHSHTSSPEIPTTPEDQASMATTASMKTRGSLGVGSRRQHRSKPPPVSLYQIKQKQSPGSSASKSKTHKAAMKAISRAAKAEANRSFSRDSSRQPNDGSDDNSNNIGDNSPTNLSQRSDDTDEIQAVSQSGIVYGAASSKGNADEIDGSNALGHSSNQPEVHIVQIRDLEDNLQHSQPTWPQAESEI